MSTSDVYRPERSHELPSLVGRGATVLPRGLGRSYGDAALNGRGATILLERLDRFLSFDSSTGILVAETGVSIGDVLRHLGPQGFVPPVLPGTKHVTLGGALACDIHGKSHHRDGAFSRAVEWFNLLLASGERVTCSRRENADVFWSTIGGMGLTGIVTEVALRLSRVESGYVRVDEDRARDLDATFALFDEGDDEYTYSVAWIDCLAPGRALGRSVLMRGRPASCRDLPAAVARQPYPPARTAGIGVPRGWPNGVLRESAMRAFNAAYFHARPARRRGVLRTIDSYFFPLDGVGNWNRLYGTRGFLQYQCVVPTAGGREALVRILEMLTRAGRGSFLAVLKRFGPAEAGQLLSFPIPGYTLAVDLPRRDDAALAALLDRIDEIVVAAGGRVYLAKDARLRAETFRAMYPELSRWREVKRRVDPDNRFSSDLARRLELEP